MEKEGFLQRWARVKNSGQSQSLPAFASDAASVDGVRSQNTGPEVSAAVPQPISPTMEDAARLTPDSDYSGFFAQGVDKAVRRVALKRLLSDPHFNLPDGLDIYMGDYNRATPVSAAMLAALHQAQGFLQQVAADAEKDASAGRNDESGQHTLAEASRKSPGGAT